MKAIVTVGVSASGKTTWAKNFAWINNPSPWKVISRDDFRRQILEEKLKRPLAAGELWKMWKWRDENIVNDRMNYAMAEAAEWKRNIIVADTNLKEGFRVDLISRLQDMGFEVEVKDFPITLEEAWKRDAGRADGVGHDIIYKQMEQWNEYVGRKKYLADTSLPAAIIFDVDGTLAHMNGKRGAFDWDKVDLDDLDSVVAAMFWGFKDAGIRMIVMSGRDGVCYEKTAKWLADNNIFYDEMFMRTAGDMRKDAEIKEELFWAHVAHKYNVIAVVDDRPVMCRRWMELGLKVFNVGNPYKEF
jgi:predicted kinase